MVDTAAEKLLKSLQENWAVILENGSEEEKNKQTSKAFAERILKAEHDHYVQRDFLKDAARLDTFEDFEEAVSGPRPSQSMSFKAKNSERFTKFAKEIDRISAQNTTHGESNPALNTSGARELSMTDAVGSIDPISKGPLIDPVRNRNCGHVYGKASVAEIMGRRCPIVGCVNRTPITPAAIYDDEEYAEKLRRQRLLSQ